MPFEVREGQGGLFVNAEKEGEQPDYRGNLRIGGVLYRIAGWKRTASSGTRWLALKVERDEQKKTAHATAPADAASTKGEFDDDIPF